MEEKENNTLDFEISFFENILKRKPDFIEALHALGDLYVKKGLYQKSLDVDKKLFDLRPDDPIILYNLSCSYSLLNRIDESLTTLKQALACGYDDIRYIEEDKDLVNLRQDTRFKKFMDEIKNRPNIKK